MTAKHMWAFRSRLRARAFGWKGSHLACQRLKEAVTEIKSVARTDPVIAGDGVVSLIERLWPAFQDIDTSSGALGGAVYWAQDELLPIVIEAPADQKTRDKWLDRLWRAAAAQALGIISQAHADLLTVAMKQPGPASDIIIRRCSVDPQASASANTILTEHRTWTRRSPARH